MKKAFAYCRYSSDHQRNESIDAQLRAIRKYADNNDILIVQTYIDEARSATTDNRPDFLRMFEDIEKVEVDTVLVHKLDRFSRDKYDSAIYKKKLKEKNITLFSITEQLGDNPEDIILESLLEGMSQYYIANLSRETMKGLMENAHRGLHNGGTPPLGYDVDPETKKYIINETEAQAVRLIFELYIKGMGYVKLCDELNKRGFTTKTGRAFRKNSFESILQNEKYKGTYVYNKTLQKVNGKRNNRIKKKDDEIIRVDGVIPAIISKDTWNEARKRKELNKHTTNHKKQNYLLNGLIYCGKCDSKLVGNSRTAGRNKTRYVTYDCYKRRQTKQCDLKSVNKEFIEKQVVKEIEKMLLDKDFLKSRMDEIKSSNNQKQKKIQSEIKALEHNLSKINRETENIIIVIKQGLFNDQLNLELKKLEESKEEIFMKIDELNAKLKEIITEDKIEDVINSYADNLNHIKALREQQQHLSTRKVKNENYLNNNPGIIELDGKKVRSLHYLQRTIDNMQIGKQSEVIEHEKKSTLEQVDFIKQNYIKDFYDFISLEDKAQLIREFVNKVVINEEYADVYFDIVHKNGGDGGSRTRVREFILIKYNN
ncbi:recombinase family protein [Haloplasma contractile]|uniref:Site-specific recombinase protein n=1 Tax=Haloplasma contractile SSD-17B TaxID=1033810 RepID=U2DV87_9MOLU|nr:recombinase family protein [Haloplasma contractile]ERJ12307.1 Site-specific recombinase protein [Haloplasma contractile SSD-17B]